MPDAHCADISPDGRVLAVGGDRGVYLLDARTGERLRDPLPIPLINALSVTAAVRFSPDGRELVEIDRGGLGVAWSFPDARELGRFFNGANSSNAPQVSFSSYSRWFANAGGPVATYEARTVRLLELIFGSAAYYEFAVSFSPDGLRLAVAGTRSISFRDPATGAQIGATIPTGNSPVSMLAYSADGAILAGARFDGSIQFWDARSGTALQDPLVGATRAPILLAFGQDADHVVEVTTQEVVTFNAAKRLGGDFPLSSDPANSHQVNAVGLSPDGSLLVATDSSGGFDVWAVATRTLRVHGLATSNAGGGALAAVFTDNHTVAIAGDDGTVTFWDALSGRRMKGPITLAGAAIPHVGTTGAGVSSIAFDARHRRLIALTGAGNVATIDVLSGRLLHQVTVEPQLTPPRRSRSATTARNSPSAIPRAWILWTRADIGSGDSHSAPSEVSATRRTARSSRSVLKTAEWSWSIHTAARSSAPRSSRITVA